MIKILFTSVGRRVELIQAFKNSALQLGINVKIYGADMSDDAPALFFCDERIKVLRISDSDYIPSLLSICMKEHINALIPTIDTDLLLLATNKKSFENAGTTVLISDADKISICRDKRFTSDFFIKCGLKAPLPVDNIDDYSSGFPCFIKPKDGSSSINAYRADTPEQLSRLVNQVPGYIIQPYISGEEYTVDIFCDFEGNPIYITPRKRLAVRSGEVLKTEIIYDETIIDECKKLIANFKPCGPITVQLIKNKSGDNYYIEINPRFGGGAPLSMKAGANSAKAIIKLLSNTSVEFDNDINYGKIYSRFDQSICVNAKPSELKAIIFDLDDTLYNEVDYVKSGYQKIAEYISEIADIDKDIIFKELFEAFENQFPAINVMLEKHGLLTNDTLNNCINIYRTQKPDITLSEYTKNSLIELRNKGFKLGIITDGRPEGQRAKIEALELEKYVDEIIITDELGGPIFRKPNDIAFRMMKYKFNLEYSEMMYVGDNIQKDFQAPKLLGMQYHLYNNPDGLYTK